MNNWASLYLISIGRSATGKEHIKTTIEEVLETAGLDALLGPSKYTSESGVMSALIDKPTHIHITDELGMQLESANKDKGSAYRDISKIEMECFGRLHGTLHPVGYSTAGMTVAQKSELASRKVKNPALTIMAMTTPDTFYDAIGSKSLRDGFLNRFIIMECHAEREPGQVCKPVEVPADAIEWCSEAVVCFGWELAMADIKAYLGGEWPEVDMSEMEGRLCGSLDSGDSAGKGVE